MIQRPKNFGYNNNIMIDNWETIWITGLKFNLNYRYTSSYKRRREKETPV